MHHIPDMKDFNGNTGATSVEEDMDPGEQYDDTETDLSGIDGLTAP